MKRFQITLILLAALVAMAVATQIKLKDIAPGASGTTPVSNGSTWTATALPTALEGTGILIPKTQRFSLFQASGSASTVFGDASGAGSGTVTNGGPDATNPVYRQFATNTTNGNCATAFGNAIHVQGRSLRFNALVRLSATANVRFRFGFTDQTAATMCGADDPAGNYVGIDYSTSRGDTNWTSFSKDNATQQLGASLTTAADTNWHYFEIIADDSVPNYSFKVDGAALSSPITANLPTDATVMTYFITVTCVTCTPTANNWRYSAFYMEDDIQ